MLRIGTTAGCVLIGLAIFGVAQEQQPKKLDPLKTMSATERSALARKALATRIEVPEEFRKQPVPLRLVLQYIGDKLRELGLPWEPYIDDRAFHEQIGGDPISMSEVDVRLPFAAATVSEWLEHALSQSPHCAATYIVRNGRVEIVPPERVNINYLLDQGIVVQFNDMPIKTAIEEVANRAGVTVLIDPRCGDMIQPVSVQSQNDVSPRGLLSAWADMFEWKLLVDEHRVMLMPRVDYLKKMRDQVEEAQLQMHLNKLLPGDIPATPERLRGTKTASPGV
jgi:hypothetical protein